MSATTPDTARAATAIDPRNLAIIIASLVSAWSRIWESWSERAAINEGGSAPCYMGADLIFQAACSCSWTLLAAPQLVAPIPCCHTHVLNCYGDNPELSSRILNIGRDCVAGHGDCGDNLSSSEVLHHRRLDTELVCAAIFFVNISACRRLDPTPTRSGVRQGFEPNYSRTCCGG